jgi:hypothetical protein
MPNPADLKLPDAVPTLTELVKTTNDDAAWKVIHGLTVARPCGAPKFR